MSAARFDSQALTTSTIGATTGVLKTVPGATVTVAVFPANDFDTLVKATLYTDSTGGTTTPNPITADSLGNFGFWVDPGIYDYWITVAGVNTGPFHVSETDVVIATEDLTFSGNDSFKKLNNIRFADQFSGATVALQIAAAIADFGSNVGIVVIPSSMGAGTATVPSNVTVMDYRAGDSAGVRIGDFTPYGLGFTPLLVARTYANPSGTTTAGAETGITAVTSFSGTSTATRGVGNTTALVVIAQGVGLTANSSAATLEVAEFNTGLTGVTAIDTIQGVVSSPGGMPGATGTVSNWDFFSAIPVFDIPTGMALGTVTGIRSIWPQNQGPGAGTITTGYTSFMSGPNNYFDGGIATGSLALPVVQVQGTSASRTGALLNATDTNTGKAVTIDKSALLHASTDGISFPGSVSGETFLVAGSAGVGGVITLPGNSGTLSQTAAGGTATLTANATLGAATSQAAITVAATGVTTGDAIEWSYASAPGAGDSLCIVSAYVTSGNVNFVRSNPTAAAQNVTAIVINWRVIR